MTPSELDERRARAILTYEAIRWHVDEEPTSHWTWDDLTHEQRQEYLSIASAIRESDDAAGIVRNVELEASLAVMQEALEWFADNKNYEWTSLKVHGCNVMADGRRKARAALSDNPGAKVMAVVEAVRTLKKAVERNPGWVGEIFWHGTDEGTILREALAALEKRDAE